MIWCVRPQPCPSFLQLCIGQSWRELQRRGDDFLQASDSYIFFEPDIFDRGASNNSSVISWHQIHVIGPEHTLNAQVCCTQGDHLPFGRTDRGVISSAFDFCRAAASSDDGPTSFYFFTVHQ